MSTTLVYSFVNAVEQPLTRECQFVPNHTATPVGWNSNRRSTERRSQAQGAGPDTWGRGRARVTWPLGAGKESSGAVRNAASSAVRAAMLSTTCRSLSQALQRPHALSAVAQRCLRAPGARSYADQNERAEQPRTFHPALLQFLVCPLSKKPLR